MKDFELEFYEAGIKDARENGRITVAAHSNRYMKLSKHYNFPIGDNSIKAVTAYNEGVAHEICRQTKLEFCKGV